MPEYLGGKEVAQRVDSVSVQTIPKKGNLMLCENNRTVSHHSKIMLRIMLNQCTS
jgi:hypothetical protein